MMRLFFIAILFSATAIAGHAQDLNFNIKYTTDCLADTEQVDAKQVCIGNAAEACMANTPGGDSTYGMGGCLSAEADWWDGQLNAADKALMKNEKNMDRENGLSENSVTSAAKALRQAQRAWIPFRDATCAYEYSQWGGGTGGGPASVACYMRMTAQQALYLQYAGFGD